MIVSLTRKVNIYKLTRAWSRHTGMASFSVVTLKEAKMMPRYYNQMNSDILVLMAVTGDQEAREERLIREIMATDNIEWDKAADVFVKITNANRKWLLVATIPYKIGIITAVVAAFGSIPMIFHLETVDLFNNLYVTSDRPEPKDLETALEVGSWAWNWMEPPLGQISFFLLCMQYARVQMENLGLKPYTKWYKDVRARQLCKEFPNYNRDILTSFSEGDPLSTPTKIDKHISGIPKV